MESFNKQLVVVPLGQLTEMIQSTVDSSMEKWLDRVVLLESKRDSDTETTMTMKQLCSQFHISRPTVYKRIASGVLKPHRIGRKIIFIKKDVIDALRNGNLG